MGCSTQVQIPSQSLRAISMPLGYNKLRVRSCFLSHLFNTCLGQEGALNLGDKKRKVSLGYCYLWVIWGREEAGAAGRGRRNGKRSSLLFGKMKTPPLPYPNLEMNQPNTECLEAGTPAEHSPPMSMVALGRIQGTQVTALLLAEGTASGLVSLFTNNLEHSVI